MILSRMTGTECWANDDIALMWKLQYAITKVLLLEEVDDETMMW